MTKLNLLVPSRETATPEIISDVMPTIMLNTRDGIIKEHGTDAGKSYKDAAQEIYAEIPVAGRSASYTGNIGLPNSIVAKRRKAYGEFLDLSSQFMPIKEEEGRRFLDYEKVACPVCDGNLLIAGTYEYGACNCPPSLTSLRSDLDSALAALPESDRDTINRIVNEYASSAYQYGTEMGHSNYMG